MSTISAGRMMNVETADKVDLEAGMKKKIGTKPVKNIPGNTGLPILGALADRLDFYYFQGQDKYFQSRADKYNSTVVRINVPPGPTMASDSRVIALLDGISFQALIDTTLVEKKDVFTGTFMPSTSLTGGYRVLSYLDPSEPKHTLIKQLLFSMLASRKDQFIPAFRTNFSQLFQTVESQITVSKVSNFNALNDVTSFEFVGEAFFGVRPSSTNLGTKGPTSAAKWLLFNLHPLVTLGLPSILEEPLLHTFPLPSFAVAGDYKALYAYFSSAATSALDIATGLGLSRDEACHNLLFTTVFNSYGGFKVLLPNMLASLASADPKVHAKLAQEIRSAVNEAGGKVTLAALEKMELTNSVVYEALRLDPPVKFQYGKAKIDFLLESHDAMYSIKKGEMLFSYQPMATRDTKIFGSDAGQFVADRFVGDEGKKLLPYVYWSNGRETETPTLGNKQCAGKNFVVLVARLFLVELFLRYDTFTAKVGKELLGNKVEFTSVTKATSYEDPFAG